MKKVLLMAVLAAAAAKAEIVDGIAARVNEEAVMYSDVLMEMSRNGVRDAGAFRPALEELINRKLIIKAAKDQKMTMQDWVVENRVREIIKRNFDGDRNRLMNQLAKDRVSYPEWHARIKDDMIVSAMRYQIVDKNAAVSPAAMKEEYETNRAAYAKNMLVSVSILLVPPDGTEGRDRLDFNAEADVYERVNPDGIFQPEVCEVIKSLKTGETSGWHKFMDYSFKVRKDGEEITEMKTFSEAYADIEAAVRAKESTRLYADWIDRLRKAAYIKIY